MPSSKMTPLRRLWLTWKTLRLPWRRKFLVGSDLQGNTFWEFRDLRGAAPSADSVRWRRIVEYPTDIHYSEVKVSPQWHQWLRHARQAAPSLAEQKQDVLRQAQLKVLAAAADARWAAKESLIEAPGKPGEELGQRVPSMKSGTGTDGLQTDARRAAGEVEIRPDYTGPGPTTVDGIQNQQKSAPGDDTWKRPQGPSEGYQPSAWAPPPSAKR